MGKIFFLFLLLTTINDKEDEDIKLIDQFLSGKEVGFNRLVLKYQNRIYNLCMRMLNNEDDALEVSQDVFLAVFVNLKKFRRESRFSTWLFAIAINHCRNKLRKKIKEEDIPDNYEEIDLKSPYKILKEKEIKRLISEAIKKLEQPYREAIILRDIEDLSYQEMSKIMKVEIGTVKSRVHRARSKIKQILKKAGINFEKL
ncbi:MAG: sigma-70 family RNA polymerase sigma factor [Deltaproteobacteria bacterium]|nr:sigma-70 family RNA polymerase sigma factor [Deltaproteobacteria bacterium]